MHVSVVIDKEYPALLKNIVTGPMHSNWIIGHLSFRELGEEVAAASDRGKVDNAGLALLDIDATLNAIHIVVFVGT